MDPLLLAVIVVALVAVAAGFLLLGRRLAGADAGELAALRARHTQLQRQHAEEATLAAERTRARDEAVEALRELRKEADELRTQRDTLSETVRLERQQSAEKLALLDEARTAMSQQFRLLAAEVMKEHGETYAKRNLEQLDGTLTPLRQKILEFQQSLQAAHTDSEKERTRLAEQIRKLGETSAAMSRETHDLTQALKGKSQTQGAWGEMILATILEKSGLREGEEYRTQVSHTTEDGDRLRPDVIVRLPNEQSIVIDAKVSLTAYAAAVSAETEEERAACLKAHVASMRQHVRVLAGKAYQAHAPGALDYVVMFVPIEGALAAALTEAPDLTTFAVENSVYLATPTTLMIALRTAANVWQVERRNRNAEKIANSAGAIYEKLVGFVGNMEDLDDKLVKARKSYDLAMGQLTSGKGSLIKRVQQLKTQGAKTNKSLPAHLLDDAGAEMAALVDEAEEAEEASPGDVPAAPLAQPVPATQDHD